MLIFIYFNCKEQISKTGREVRNLYNERKNLFKSSLNGSGKATATGRIR